MRSSVTPHVILFVAFVLRIANLNGESLWRDEVDSVRFAFEPLTVVLANFTATGFNGPLYHLVLRGWLSLTGVSDFGLRSLSLVCGVLLVALIYALGKRMFGRPAATIAMWLTAISPVLIWYAGEGKMYSLQPALLALALYALMRAVDGWAGEGAWALRRSSAAWWGVFILATSLSFYVHVLSPLFLPVAALFFFALWPGARRHLVGGAVALLALTLPYLPLLLWQAPVLLRGGDIGHRFYPLDQMAWVLASNWTFGLDAHAPLLFAAEADVLTATRRIGVGVGVVLTAVGLMTAARRAADCPVQARVLRLQLATLGWLILPATLIFLISTRLPIFQPRYVLWSAPALSLLIGVGLACLLEGERTGRLAGGLLIVVVSAVGLLGVAAQIINPIRPDVRGAVAYVTQRARPGDAIVFQIPYMRYSFAYYAERFGYPLDRLWVIEAPYTNHGMTPDAVAQTMRGLIGVPGRVWLFESEAPMWDRDGLVRRWFDDALALSERQDFRGVAVGLYRAKEAPGP